MVYGFPRSQPDALENTNTLLQMAFSRATTSAVPCIVAGDFNCPPLDLPAGQDFAQLGYQEAFHLHRHRTGVELPPTCKNSTRHDTALIHPALVPHWHGAQVLSDVHLFDSHAPLRFGLDTFQNRPCKHVWDLPRPWSDLGPDPVLFEKAFATRAPALKRQALMCSSVNDINVALLSFSAAAEDAVASALARQHEADPVRMPHSTLPRAYRGRCRERELKKRDSPALSALPGMARTLLMRNAPLCWAT